MMFNWEFYKKEKKRKEKICMTRDIEYENTVLKKRRVYMQTVIF